MTEPEKSGGLTVLSSSDQAQALLESVNHQILGQLLKNPSSASELAKVLERPLKVVIYRLEKLLEVGLVEVLEQRRRGGRAVKVFTACSKSGWSFPFALTPAATVKELLEGQILPLMGEILGHLAARVRAEVWIDFKLEPDRPARFDLRTTDALEQAALERQITGTVRHVQLSSEQAQRFNDKLRALSLELDGIADDSGLPSYAVGLFFVPKSVEEA